MTELVISRLLLRFRKRRCCLLTAFYLSRCEDNNTLDKNRQGEICGAVGMLEATTQNH